MCSPVRYSTILATLFLSTAISRIDRRGRCLLEVLSKTYIKEKSLDFSETPPHEDDEIAISLLLVVMIRGVGTRENTI